MRKLNYIFLVMGAFVLAFLVIRIGPSTLLAKLNGLSFLFLLAMGAVLLSKLLMALGWKALLYPERLKAGLWDLSVATFVGGAINDVTPGGVAGEPLKLSWLTGKVPDEDLVSSLILHNYLYAMTNVILIVAAGIYLLFGVALPSWARWSVGMGMALVLLFVVLMAMVIRWGFAEKVLRLLHRLHIRFKDPETLIEKARKADLQARTFFKERPWDMIRAFGWILLSRLASAMENYVILLMMGQFVSVGDVLLITCMTVAVFILFAFVPSQLGALEGGAYLLYPLIGISASVGVAVEMVRRLRIILMLLMSLVLIALRNLNTTSAIKGKIPKPSLLETGLSGPPLNPVRTGPTPRGGRS